MKFSIEKSDIKSSARAGTLELSRGTIQTPIFMPVGTQATVKAVHQHELEEVIQSEIILGNTYHLYLRPGTQVLQEAGGIHSFMNWNKPVLTDSGGYQVYSLSQRRKITENAVTFNSLIDGSKHEFSPEKAIQIQRAIGADIIMAFDECTPYPCDYDYAKKSMELTHRWLDRCCIEMNNSSSNYGHEQILAGIVQGSIYADLRKESAEFISSRDLQINAIGGLSVGEPHDIMYEVSEQVCSILPKASPRYLMGVGTPTNILECISLGVDMFDCVLPTRNARHGILYTTEGEIRIKNAKWANDFSAIDPNSTSPLSRNHSKAYLRHLFQVKEYLAAQIASVHNLSFYLWLVKEARERIVKGNFTEWKNDMVKKLTNKL